MALSADDVHARLRESAKKVRLSRSFRYLLTGITASLFFLILSLLLDSWLHLGRIGRWVGFLTVLTPLAAGAVYTALRWRMRMSPEGIARRIEEACEGAGNVLINAVQFDAMLPANSPLRRALFAEMENPFPRVRWNDVFDSKMLQRIGGALAIITLFVAIWAVVSPHYFVNSASRIFLPASNIAALTRTKIVEITPADARIVHGAEHSLTLVLGGDIPSSAWIYFRDIGSSWQRQPMSREVGSSVFVYRWKEVRQPMEFYIAAGDTASEMHRVSVRPKTAIKSKLAEITLPAYTHQGTFKVSEFTMIQNILPGSTISLALEFNYPLTELRASSESNQQIKVSRIDDHHWRLEEQVMANHTLKLQYRDADQFSDNEQLTVGIKLDEAPKINIIAPAEGKELIATRDASLAVRFAATDNFGLGTVALYRSTSEAQMGQLVQEWSDSSGKTEFNGNAALPLGKFASHDDERVSFCLVAKDLNSVTGPGVTISRPIVVTLRSPEKIKQEVEDAVSKLTRSVEELIKLQETNLTESRGIGRMKSITPEAATPLLTRQIQIGQLCSTIAASAQLISPKLRQDLRLLVDNEMKEAVLALRNTATVVEAERGKFLTRAIGIEAAILARLQGAPEAMKMDAERNAVADMLGGLEELKKKQVDLWDKTKVAADAQANTLANQQDALAAQSVRLRKTMENENKTSALKEGDYQNLLKNLAEDPKREVEKRWFEDRERNLIKVVIEGVLAAPAEMRATANLSSLVAKMLTALKIYEEMLGASEQISSKKYAAAASTQKHVAKSLQGMIYVLNAWQVANAEKKSDDVKDKLSKLKAKLDKLSVIQREIVEKSKELARKNELKSEDIATAKDIKESKDLMKDVIEQMATDLQAIPENKAYNMLKNELMTIYEDVIQTDKEEAEAGQLQAKDIPVQKEDGILQGIENAKKLEADMEMWLPDKNDTAKFLQENFDVAEMPEIPNLGLVPQFEDIVGQMLDEQKGLDANDATSNQALAQAANGWEIGDGQMPGYSAQGRTGNRKPEHNEQMGRSSGGRQGMSDGEMVGQVAKNLQGDKADARRSKDPLNQKGQVKDEDGPAETRATGGGKAGAFSDRLGFSGAGPAEESKAPRKLAKDAKAAEQALLSLKTTKVYAQAQLLNLRSDGLGEVARLQDQAADALREGRLRDFDGLHQRIVRQLQQVKSELAGREVVAMPAGDAARVTDKQLLGGNEGDVPNQYKDMVADYYRSLSEGK